MFNVADDKKIGEHLSMLILDRYASKRKFCIAYLKTASMEINNEEIQKMANRFSQITKGKKSIQTYDLQIVTKLLEVTAEEILSAGQHFVPRGNRVTNYSIAFSKDEDEWTAFIDREDNLILNPDEYGKNAIDYAIEFKNHAFLKFLMDKKYIWFDSGNSKDYIMTFGAGTSIKRREIQNIDTHLLERLGMKDGLRMDMISLAIENNDSKMLNELRARELPELYYRVNYINYSSTNYVDFDNRYDENTVRHISNASDEVFDYFTDEFDIQTHTGRILKFLYPSISQVLDFAIENHHPRTEFALKNAIKHNRETYDELRQLIENFIQVELEDRRYSSEIFLDGVKPDILRGVLDYYDCIENGNIVRFFDRTHMAGIITNVANTNKLSKDAKINCLINELNDLYKKINNMKAQPELWHDHYDKSKMNAIAKRHAEQHTER